CGRRWTYSSLATSSSTNRIRGRWKAIMTGGKNLYSTERRPVSRKQLRSFGFILAGGFLVIGLWPMIFRHQDPRIWALAIAAVSGLGGLLVPAALRHPYRLWMALGLALGWVNSKILLSIIFYGLVTPTRMVMTAMGRDLLQRKFDQSRSTYRVNRKPRPIS